MTRICQGCGRLTRHGHLCIQCQETEPPHVLAWALMALVVMLLTGLSMLSR